MQFIFDIDWLTCIDSFVNSAAVRFRSACAAVRPVQCENARLHRENLFSIFRDHTGIRPDVRDGVSESVSRNRESYYREKYFWIDPRFQSGSAARAERKPRWSEHDEDVRDKMQEAGAGAEIPRGCMPRMRGKMQLPCGPTFLQQFYASCLDCSD